jgi:hypothetical protein
MDSLDALRQTWRWRLWVRGMQVGFLAIGATFAFGFLAMPHVPKVIGAVVVLIGMAVALSGFVMLLISVPVLMVEERLLFIGRQSAVQRAILKDVFSLRKPPPPPPDPPWWTVDDRWQ